MVNSLPPVITIDGPSGSGKGTIALMLAKHLGWHMLDSGAVYRAIAWAALHYQVSLDDTAALSHLLQSIHIVVESQNIGVTPKVTCDDHVITALIRSEECGQMASQIAAIPLCRELFLPYQRNFRLPPGLIADGRDMGTTVFPEALLKFYFYAEASERARRRYQELQAKGINVSLRDIQDDLSDRDRRDAHRTVSPTRPAQDAISLNTTGIDISAVFKLVLDHVKACGL